MKFEIIPTIFALSKWEFEARLESLLPLRRNLQIDFMDGKFVESKGINVSDVMDLRKFKVDFEAHLMVENPLTFIEPLRKRGFKKIIFHSKSINEEKINSLIKEIRKNKMKPWIAFNPDEEIDDIFWMVDGLEKIEGVMFMGVNPGKEGQELDKKVLDKLEVFREAYPHMKIQIDGGVNESNIKEIVKLGVNIVNVGSAIYNSKDPKSSLDKLENAVQNA